MLQVQGLNKTYRSGRGLFSRGREVVAAHEVGFELRRGETLGLVGESGSGKSSVGRCLVGLAPFDSGRILFKGRDITAMRAADVARLGLVRSFQISAVFPHLTVLENVRVALQRHQGTSFHFWKAESSLHALHERATALIEAVNLTPWTGHTAAELPYGRKRALEIATTLALDPEVMLLDEPLAGMGHEDIERTAALIKRVAADRTILMVEHNLSVVADLSDRITVLARGEILAEGTYAEVSRDARVMEAYMGTGHA